MLSELVGGTGLSASSSCGVFTGEGVFGYVEFGVFTGEGSS
jgi:hypothetical protein